MNKLRFIGILLLVIAIVFSSFPAFASESAALTRCSVKIRAKANASSSSLAVLSGGTKVIVLSSTGTWWKVKYGSYTGYIHSDYLMQQTRNGYYPLHKGDDNEYVETLQKKLKSLGFYADTIDGVYGDTTFNAVKEFQKANGLSADGIAGGETQAKLYSSAATPASVTIASTSANSTVSSNYITLKNGMSGNEVKTLQERLISLGYLSSSATGYYGTATTSAVKAFQKAHGLTVDGKAGPATQSVLYSSASKAVGSVQNSSADSASGTEAYATLRPGMTSSDVKALQKVLISLGYLKTNATGYYGTATTTAVKKFQGAYGLTADGIAGPATIAKLYGTDSQSTAPATANPSSESQTYAMLKQGQTSTDVKNMQTGLRELGYLNASSTGYFGSATLAAVKAFQKANGLTVDGIAGNATLQCLYSGSAVKASGASSSSETVAPIVTGGKISGPSKSSIQLLHWQNYVKGKLAYGDTILLYDPASGYGWNLKVYSRGRHLDAEPLTSADTSYMNAAFGGVTTWTPKVVWVKLPNGEWTMATTHNTPHESQSIKTNNFEGHLCVHFLRDMAECKANDPNYGVTHQNAIRAGWLALTGQVIN